MKYKTKPCEIEAIEYTGKNGTEILHFMFPDIEHDATSFDETIKTLEGEMHCSVGDFIIKGLKGEFYPCKPDIFNLKYQPCDTIEQPKDDVKEDWVENKIDGVKMAIHHILQKEIADKVWYQDKGCEIQLKNGLDNSEKEIAKYFTQQKEAIEREWKDKIDKIFEKECINEEMNICSECSTSGIEYKQELIRPKK